jgi:hypothetical protein
MLIWHNVSVCSAVGLALCLASPAEAAKKHRKPTAAYHSMVHRQAAVAPRSAFQGGVLAGPLYNGQDYIGDDPDPNIRAYLIKDKTRYGGQR